MRVENGMQSTRTRFSASQGASVDYWYREVQEKISPKYSRCVRLMGTCHIALGAACLGAYPGVGAFHSTRQNSYLGAYPEYYGMLMHLH